MKKYLLLIFVLAISFSVLFVSCKKKDNCNAATEGNLTVVAYLKDHGRIIPNQAWHPDTVFVKFNIQNSPGSNPGNYDTYFIGAAGEDYIRMKGLNCGDYYFYGVGLDTTLDTVQNPHVVGGISFSTDNSSGEMNFDIPVSE